MNYLPFPVADQISACLECDDLRSLRLVNKLFAATSAKYLFAELHFNGAKQTPRYGYVGRSRIVRCAKLDEAIADVLPIARHVKKLYFTPAVAIIALKDDDSTLEVDKVIWQRKDSDGFKVREVMNTLFDEMASLQHVEIAAPMVSQHIIRTFADVMDETQVHTAVLPAFVHHVSQSIHHTQRHIEGLRITGLNGDDIKDTPAVRHMFSGLKNIELNIHDPEFLLERNNPSVLGELLSCAKDTLEHLRLTFGYHIHLPQRDVHSLAHLLFSGGLPIPFPRLQSLSLVTIILSAQPLIDFLAAQPQVSLLTTSHVYLGSSDIGWPEVVRSFPTSLKEWRQDSLGHYPVAGFTPPISYNWTKGWYALEDATVRSMGWEQDLEPKDYNLFCLKRKLLVG